MRKCSGKILAAVLTGFALASAVSAGTLAAQEGNRPAMGDIRRIQAYTDETVYGWQSLPDTELGQEQPLLPHVRRTYRTDFSYC